jgi:hypothetical protein
MSKPMIQIDDVVREMTDEEYSKYLLIYADSQPLTDQTNDSD